MPPKPSKTPLVLGLLLGIGITLGPLRKIYRAARGRERLPIYWILGRWLGNYWGGEIGNALDNARDEPNGAGPNWGALMFYLLLLAGWVMILYAWLSVK